MNLLTEAITHTDGITALARACGVTYQAVRRWERAGKLPRSDLTGETDYAKAIAKATRRKITRRALIEETRKAWQKTA